MKNYDTQHLRNIGLFGHGSTGKTTLAEAMLFNAGAVERFGSVTKGSTASDFDPDEVKRGISIFTTMVPFEYKNNRMNVLDTPGFLDFIAQVKSTLNVVESGIFVLPANSGVEVGLERVWKMANACRMAKVFFINKMDKENSDFFKCVENIEATLKFSGTVVPIQLPIGSAENFTGVVDLLEKCSYTYKDGKAEKGEIPANMEDKVEEYLEKVAEAAAGDNEELMEKFFEGELSQEDIKKALKNGVAKGKVIPVLCGSAEKNIAITTLMDFMVDYLPNPAFYSEYNAYEAGTENMVEVKPVDSEPFAAQIFKTTTDPYVGKLSVMRIYSGTLKADMEVYNPNKDTSEKIGNLMLFCGKNHEVISEASAGDIVTVGKLSVTETSDTLCSKDRKVQFETIEFPEPLMTLAVFPKSKGDEDKLGSSLTKIMDEDPTIRVSRDTATKETIISGMGDLHISIMMDRLKRKFGVDVELKTPKIPYKETLKSSTKQEFKYKKQSGGRGQYGHVCIEIDPLPRDQDFEFVDRIVGGVIPKNYIPGVEKGVRKAMEEGALAGYPMVSVKTTLYYGSYHTVDSSDLAFQIAGSMAFKKGAMNASPILLEPIMDVEVIVPDSFMGDVIGDMNSRRGRIMGMDPLPDGEQSIKAQVPLAEMQKYSIELRSITQGRGEFKMQMSRYEEVPAQIAEGIIAAAKKEEE